MNDIYGGLWKKWRDKKNLTDAEWDELVKECGEYGRKYKTFCTVEPRPDGTDDLVGKLILFFLEVIEQREKELIKS